MHVYIQHAYIYLLLSKRNLETVKSFSLKSTRKCLFLEVTNSRYFASYEVNKDDEKM